MAANPDYNSLFYYDTTLSEWTLRGTLNVDVTEGGKLEVNGTDVSSGLDDISAVNGIATGTAAQFGGLIEVVRVHNGTGGTLAKGDIISLVGVHTDGLPKAVKADANAVNLKAQGAIQADILNGAAGLAIIRGLSPATLNTNSFSAIDDPVYLSETAGAVATTEETEGDEISQIVGYVVVKSATLGQIHYRFDKVNAIGHGEIQPDAVRASELGVTAGTGLASRALVLDANADITTGIRDLLALRNVSLTGTLTGVTDLTTTGNTIIGNAAVDTVKLHGTAGSGAQETFQATVVTTGTTQTTPYGFATAAQGDNAIAMINKLQAMAVNHGLMAAS